MKDNINIIRIEKDSVLAGKLLKFVETCSWYEAREHIASNIRQWAFSGWEAVFAAVCGDEIVGMTSIMKTDYYPITDIYPWISSVFVTEAYRGRRISGLLIEAANIYARSLGFTKTYIPSEHTGLYEKYGYVYQKDIVNYGGGTDRLYMKEI